MQSARTFMQSLMRRNDPTATTELSGLEFTHQRGVVDECCKKQCSLTTLVSYCANARDITNVNLQEILSSIMEPAISEEVKPGSPQVNKSNFQNILK